MRRYCFSFLSASLLIALSAFLCLQASMSQPSPSAEALQSWQKIQSSGDKAFEACEYGNAERLLTKAVKQARNLGTADIGLAKSSGELGRLLTVRGRFDEAEPLLEEELSIKEKASGGDMDTMIPAMGSLIRFYLTHGTAGKADDMTYDLLAFLEGKIRKQSTQPGGRVKLKKGGALKGWAGTAAPAVRDPLIEWSIICDMIGNLYKARGNFVMAERLFKAGLDMKTTVLGKKHLALAHSYDNLGSIYMEQGDYENAESYYEDAFKMTDRIVGPEDPKFYSLLNKLAICLIKEKKYAEAEALYLRAKNYWQANPNNLGLEQHTLFALGCLHCDQKRYSAAAPHLEQALRIAERYHGNWSVQLVPYLRKYAYVQYYLGQKEQREQLNARASTISPVLTPLKTTRKMELGSWSKETN